MSYLFNAGRSPSNQLHLIRRTDSQLSIPTLKQTIRGSSLGRAGNDAAKIVHFFNILHLHKNSLLNC